jgi:RNA polymerase sigma-70 factor (ECF subfamily)
VASRDSVRLAFIAALQHLSARQRAVLLLREVLQWKAAEVGEAIGASTAAVNSLLQRARAQLDEIQPSQDDDIAAPQSPEAQEMLAKYVHAFETYDMDQLVKLFTDDAIFEMPPFDGWYRGPADIVTLSTVHCPAQGAGDMRFVSTTANGQPAAALYMLNPETGAHEAFQLHVLSVQAGGVSHVVAFHAQDGDLFEKFGLAPTL